VELLNCYQEMIKVHGWNGTAATLGMTKSALEARVYEVKGVGMRVDTALLIQRYAGTKHFAQAVAFASGGVYFDLPPANDDGNHDPDEKLLEIMIEAGEYASAYKKAKEDGVINRAERAHLHAIEQQMHKSLCELRVAILRKHGKDHLAVVDMEEAVHA
jgi:hypothetical protein